MSILDAIFQGFVQGLTEFLPVSSSGHLSLFQHFTGTSGVGGQMFTVMLHLGTLLAVFICFYKTIFNLIGELFLFIKDIFTLKLSFKNMTDSRRMLMMLFISIVPLAFFYFIKDLTTFISEDNDIIIEGVLFLVTSIMLFIAEKSVKGKKTAGNMKAADALFVGTFQGIATFPAISRSGSTISALMLRGFSKDYAVTFSFIMGMPAILGASILEFKDAIVEKAEFDTVPILVGIITSLVVGILSIKLVKYLVKSDKFIIFAYYTFVLGIVVITLGILENFGISFQFTL